MTYYTSSTVNFKILKQKQKTKNKKQMLSIKINRNISCIKML